MDLDVVVDLMLSGRSAWQYRHHTCGLHKHGHIREKLVPAKLVAQLSAVFVFPLVLYLVHSNHL
jgi:hypothetical protein